MSDEISNEDLEHIRIQLSLERFGELVAHVATHFAQLREIAPPDYEGQEMRDLAVSSWRHVCFMADREEFVTIMQSDLAQLETGED